MFFTYISYILIAATVVKAFFIELWETKLRAYTTPEWRRVLTVSISHGVTL